jgi:hypothetical protein
MDSRKLEDNLSVKFPPVNGKHLKSQTFSGWVPHFALSAMHFSRFLPHPDAAWAQLGGGLHASPAAWKVADK